MECRIYLGEKKIFDISIMSFSIFGDFICLNLKCVKTPYIFMKKGNKNCISDGTELIFKIEFIWFCGKNLTKHYLKLVLRH